MGDDISWVLELSINDGQKDAFEALMNEMVAYVKANEPGAQGYSFSISEDEETVVIYEAYEDNDATMVHLQGFGQHFGERFMGCVTPVNFLVFGPADNRVREVLEGFGPTYLKHWGGF